MIDKYSMRVLGVIGVIFAASVSSSSAALQMIQEKDWLGYFIGISENDFRFGITPDGKGTLKVLTKRGDTMSRKLDIFVDVQVVKVMPDGKVTRCAILPETLESTQAPAIDPAKTIIQGKVQGNASFEITVEKGRAGLLVGGRLTDPGTLAANSPRFSITVKIPNVYEDTKQGGDRKAIKKQEEEREGNRIQVVLVDQTKAKLSTSDSVDAGSKEINGSGIMSAEISLSPYLGKDIILTSSPNSTMAFSNKSPAPLQDGFMVTWSADPVKDPKGAARLSIAIK